MTTDCILDGRFNLGSDVDLLITGMMSAVRWGMVVGDTSWETECSVSLAFVMM